MLKRVRVLALCLFFAASSLAAAEFSIHGTTDKKVAIYQPGEEMVFTLKVLDGDTPVAGNKIKWTRTGDDGKTDKGEGVVDENGLVIKTSMATPGFVRIRAYAFGEDGKHLQGYAGGWGKKKPGNIFFDGGACVEPHKLQPVEEPKDFDEFWKSAKAELAAVPIKAERKELPLKNNDKAKLWAVKLDCAGPKPVTGYLTIPAGAKEKSMPGIVQFHGYGVREHKAPSHGNEHNIIFNINAHGMELGKDAAYYEQLKKDLKSYCFKNDENSDRKKTYYYGMALRVIRALEYVKSLPEWNGKELKIHGGSQGGLQGLWAAGLDKDATSASLWSPWCCDFGGITLGRLRGWRPDYNRELDYFDPVFHARRIKCKTHLIANYGDYTCPPSSVWVAYNSIPHDNKSIEVKQGCTHSFKMKNHAKYVFTPEGVRDIGVSSK